MKERFKSAFSLMEMMIVLLIVAIVAAATAPMVTKKMTRAAIQGASSGGGLWIDVSDTKGKGIAFNLKGDKKTSVLIGSASIREGDSKPKLVIKTTGGEAPIAFTTDDSNYVDMIVDKRSAADGGQRIGITDAVMGQNSVAFGMRQVIGNDVKNSITIGNDVHTVVKGAGNWTDGVIGIGHDIFVTPNHGIAIGFEIGKNAKANNESFRGISIGYKIGSSDGTRDGGIAIGEDGWVNGMYAAPNAVAIGSSVRAHNYDTIAIGLKTEAGKSTDGVANHKYATAIGSSTTASGQYSTAIGTSTTASGQYSIAIGKSTTASGQYSTAIGHGATASAQYSTAIGYGATADTKDTIVLGNANQTVYIPGNLVVQNVVVKGNAAHERDDAVGLMFYAENAETEGNVVNSHWRRFAATRNIIESNGMETAKTRAINLPDWANISDRRLKNVGEKFTSGLAELKKLDLYHFTYKKDENKTPHVGVIAQDLQKVFPDAVTKGDDGYLRIRLEDMFYAMINAIKEIDNKITEIVQKVQNNTDEVTELKTVVTEQKKTIDAQQKTIDELVKRLDKLEKKQKKEEK